MHEFPQNSAGSGTLELELADVGSLRAALATEVAPFPALTRALPLSAAVREHSGSDIYDRQQRLAVVRCVTFGNQQKYGHVHFVAA